MPITFSSPRAQPEVVNFFILNESQYFSLCKFKISVQILCSFGDKTKIVKLNGISEKKLFIFIIASSPGVYTFLPLESKQEATAG